MYSRFWNSYLTSNNIDDRYISADETVEEVGCDNHAVFVFIGVSPYSF